MNKCGKKGPIFPTQESQIIYVNALLPGSETWLTPFEVQRIGLSISLPLKRVWKKNQLADTTSTKRSRIKLPFISHVLIMCPNYDMRDAVTQCEGHAASVTFFPLKSKLIMKKASDKPKVRKILCHIWPVLFEMIKVMKARTDWEAVQTREDKEVVITKCNVTTWIET